MAHTNSTYDELLISKKIKYIRLGKYTTSLNPIEHQCTVCGTIVVKPPKKVLAGVGCKACAIKKLTGTQEEYDTLISESTYERIGTYQTRLIEIDHKCKVCNQVIPVRPASILQGHGCKYCSNRATRTTDQYISDLAGRNITCDDTYTNSKTLLNHTCTICNNTWKASPNNVVSKDSGCPKCALSLKISKGELEILEYIKSKYTGWIIENDRDILEGKELDIVLPDLGLAIEYNGTYWHNDQHVPSTHHSDKTNRVTSFGYKLIQISEDEWKNKQEIVKSRLNSILGLSTKVAARKCELKEISYVLSAEFLNNNHIQGACTSSISYGLYYTNELVAVMTFGTPRFSKSHDYELLRYCSKIYTTVIGGASKLLKHFKDTHKGNIISYSDRRWSTGNLYKTLGFKFLRTSEPSYRYYKGLKSLSRYQCQKHKLVSEGYDENMTEKEIMNLRGYYAVYDCGNDVWEF